MASKYMGFRINLLDHRTEVRRIPGRLPHAGSLCSYRIRHGSSFAATINLESSLTCIETFTERADQHKDSSTPRSTVKAAAHRAAMGLRPALTAPTRRDRRPGREAGQGSRSRSAVRLDVSMGSSARPTRPTLPPRYRRAGSAGAGRSRRACGHENNRARSNVIAG